MILAALVAAALAIAMPIAAETGGNSRDTSVEAPQRDGQFGVRQAGSGGFRGAVK